MHPARLVLSTAALAFALAPVAAADAALLPGLVADGPTAAGTAIDAGEADVAPDGSGGVAYVKGGDVYVAPLAGGVIGAPVLVESLAGAASEARLAAGDGGRLTVVFLHAGAVKAVTRAAAGASFSAPVAVAAPAGANTQDDPSVDTDAAGRGYVAWHENDGADEDARAARLDGGAFIPLAGVLDTDDATRLGGKANNKPGVRVAVDAAGRGVVAWGEGLDEISARRLDGVVAGPAIRVDPPSYGGLNASAAGNRNLEQVSVAVDADGTAAIAWREQFDEGGNNRSRALMRIVPAGSVVPGDVRDLDGLAPPVGMAGGEFPRVAIAGGAVLGASYGQFDARIWGGRFGGAAPVAPQKLDQDDPKLDGNPNPAIGASGAGLLAYGSDAKDVRARVFTAGGLDGTEVLLSRAFGAGGLPSAGRQAAASPAGDVLVAFRQREGTSDRLVVALLDQPPVAAKDLRVEGATARWTPATDLWGALTQEVKVDGVVVGTATSSQDLGALSAGTHTIEVVARDARGQTASSGVVTFAVAASGGGGEVVTDPPLRDLLKPTLSFAAPRKVRRGRLVSFKVTASDAGGIARITFRCGTRGGFEKVLANRVRCRAPQKRRTLKITVRVTDRAGNLQQKSASVKVR